MACGSDQAWLASSMILTSSPTASRTMNARRTSCAWSLAPTFSFIAVKPASTAAFALSRICSSLYWNQPTDVSYPG